MNKRHYEHTLPNIRGSLSNTYFKILPYGQSDGRICIPYRAHTGKNGLPAGMTGHMNSPRVRRR